MPTRTNCWTSVLPTELVGTLATFLDPVSIGNLAVAAGPHDRPIIGRVLKDRATEPERELATAKDQQMTHILQRWPRLRDSHAWIDRNRHMFRRPVWGPVLFEITGVEDSDIAAYLQQHVPTAKLQSFVVECEEDFNLLYREVRQRQGMAISIIRVDAIPPRQRRYSENKMAMLQNDHGIVCYLDEAVSAPEVVMQALRDTTQIDSVLVGSTIAQESLDRRDLMDVLTRREDGSSCGACVFTRHNNRSFKYTSTLNRYAEKKFLRVDEINAATMLLWCTDARASLERDVAELHRQIERLAEADSSSSDYERNKRSTDDAGNDTLGGNQGRPTKRSRIHE